MNKKYSRYLIPNLLDAKKRIKNASQICYFTWKDEYNNIGLGKKYILKTYGCQGNLADSEKISGMLEKMGYEIASDDNDANLIIFNTCAIRENAENRVFGEIGRTKSLKRKRTDLLLAVCGCMSQEEKVVTKIKEKHPQIDIIFGTHNIHMLAEYLYDVSQNPGKIIDVMSYEGDIIENIPLKRAHSKKAWVNIMYGCDEFCTYCIVPYTRGKERSRLPEDIIEEVKSLSEEGYIEITLLGQNVNAYGNDLTDLNYTFGDLLTDLAKTSIKRIRFTTSHPRDLDIKTIDAMAKHSNIMPHLHLPVQSGSDEVLKKMNRKYTKEEYLFKINLLRERMPDISITTDIIVGFPTEDKKDFEETLDLVERAGFEGAFTFIFSPREGTPAAKYTDSIPEAEKKERLLTLNKLINDGFAKGNKRFEGKTVEVLVEGYSAKDSDILTGYTPHNKLVNFAGTSDMIGKIVNVEIDKAYTWHLHGEFLSDKIKN